MLSIKMENNLAPIGLSAYGRVKHLRQTVDALRENEGAKESVLYIFSDAPKPGDEEKVTAVRSYLRTISGFRDVHIVERTVNNRAENNRGGMRMLLEKYGKMIFLEEDVVTAPSFLKFMNDSLEVYRGDARVFAVNAYTPPIAIPERYPHLVMLLPRFSAWGFGIWKERYDEIIMDISPGMYDDVRCSGRGGQAYSRGGDDALTQLWLQTYGYIDALDVRIDYTMYVKGRQYVVCPVRSLAHSTGCDGSGEHWVQPTRKYDVMLSSSSPVAQVASYVEPNSQLINALSVFYSLSMKGLLVRCLMELGLYPMLRSLKRRLR